MNDKYRKLMLGQQAPIRETDKSPATGARPWREILAALGFLRRQQPQAGPPRP